MQCIKVSEWGRRVGIAYLERLANSQGKKRYAVRTLPFPRLTHPRFVGCGEVRTASIANDAVHVVYRILPVSIAQ